MSADGSTTRQWGEAERTFRLRIGELRKLEASRNSGSLQILDRLADGSWRVDDITETLRLALIGGGVPEQLAFGLVAKYVSPTNYLGNVIAARQVLSNALFGDPDDAVGKALAEAVAAPTGEPDSRPTSEPVPQWDGRSPTSMNAHYGSSPPLSTDGSNVTARTTNGSSQ